jgi:hypothetical protein
MTHSRPELRVGGIDFSYVLMEFVFVVLLYVVNVRPGWQSLPFVTDEATQVVWLLNVVLVLGLVANFAYLFNDSTRLRALGSYAMAGVTVLFLVRLLETFPFDFGSQDSAWSSFVTEAAIAALLFTLYRASRAAVRLVRGRRVTGLASRHA